MAERKNPSPAQWLSGFHAVEAALQHDPERVLSVIFEQGRQDKRVQQLRVLAQSCGVSIEDAPEKVSPTVCVPIANWRVTKAYWLAISPSLPATSMICSRCWTVWMSLPSC